MSPTAHVVYGGAAAAVIYPAAGVYSLVFWAASFLIDIDHYIDYVYHNGFTDWSFKKMFDYNNALDAFWFNPAFLNLEIFHTVEVMLPLYLLTAWTGSALLMAVFFGFVFHIALDMVYLYRNDIFFMRAYSITEYFMRMRAIKEKGYRPEEIFGAVLSVINGTDKRA